jgi:hypothetical protein
MKSQQPQGCGPQLLRPTDFLGHSADSSRRVNPDECPQSAYDLSAMAKAVRHLLHTILAVNVKRQEKLTPFRH